MNCTDIKAILSALIDDELDASRRHEAERHLADCQTCRDLLSHAERIDALIAADGEALAATAAISPGFEAAVLNRTVFARDRAAVSARWATWGGWLAAAACLALAMTIWLVDQRTLRDRLAGREGNALAGAGDPSPSVAAASLVAQSWTFDEAQPAEIFSRPLVPRASGDDESARSQALAAPQTLSLDDAETLYAAAIVLEGLAEASHDDAATIERLRRIAAFDELQQRLVSVRGRVNRADRPTIYAVEGAIAQLAVGALEPEAFDNLNRTIEELDLVGALNRVIGNRWNLDRSL